MEYVLGFFWKFGSRSRSEFKIIGQIMGITIGRVLTLPAIDDVVIFIFEGKHVVHDISIDLVNIYVLNFGIK